MAIILAPDPRTERPEIPEHVAAAIFQALSNGPGARFNTAGEFAAALA